MAREFYPKTIQMVVAVSLRKTLVLSQERTITYSLIRCKKKQSLIHSLAVKQQPLIHSLAAKQQPLIHSLAAKQQPLIYSLV